MITIAIRQAQELLVNTEFSIEEVATRTGFTDVSCLYRNFVALRGLSPLEYRQRWSAKRPREKQ